MPKDTRTREKTPLSSLCKQVAFELPTSWGALSQADLRWVLRLLHACDDALDSDLRMKTAALARFAGIDVLHLTDHGWVCGQRSTGKQFVLAPYLLPAVVKPLDWIDHPELIGVRIERVDGHKAVDFELQELPFGDYLMAENLYQSFLQSRQDRCLTELARLLYRIPDGEPANGLNGEVTTGVLLWFNAAKQLLARTFPHFLKPASDGGEPVTQESLAESMRAQIRLLTKGDVTKQKYILEQTDTWTALAELDALAREAEEIQRKYGK